MMKGLYEFNGDMMEEESQRVQLQQAHLSLSFIKQGEGEGYGSRESEVDRGR